MDELYALHLDPIAGQMGGGGGEAAMEPSAPAIDSTAGLDPSALSERPDLSGGDAGGPGAGGMGAVPADPNVAAATQAQTIRDAAKYYGVDLSQFEDDGQAFAHLVQVYAASKQRNYYTELGQQIAPHAGAVQQYLRDYQSRQQQAQAPQRQAWEAPEFDERWMTLVDRDEATGRFIPKAGVNPQYADKINDYADHVERWTTQLARQPREALSGLIEEVASKLLEDRFGRHQAHAEAQGIIAGNESWLYQADAQGRRLTDQAGKFLPTPLGARYYTHLQVLQRSGVRDARTLDHLAKQLLQADLAAGQVRQPASTPQAQAAMGHPNVNPGQAASPTRRLVLGGATDPSEEGLSLSERFRKSFAEEGVSDADFQQMFA